MAPSIVSLILSEEWLPCVPFLRILCVILMVQPIYTSNRNAVKAMGYGNILLKLETVRRIVGITLLISTMRFGVMAIALAMLVTEFLGIVIISIPNWKLLDYSFTEQVKDIFPSILLAVAMGIFVWVMGWILPFSMIAKTVIQIAIGGSFYVIVSIFTKDESFKYLYNIMRQMVGKDKD